MHVIKFTADKLISLVVLMCGIVLVVFCSLLSNFLHLLHKLVVVGKKLEDGQFQRLRDISNSACYILHLKVVI